MQPLWRKNATGRARVTLTNRGRNQTNANKRDLRLSNTQTGRKPLRPLERATRRHRARNLLQHRHSFLCLHRRQASLREERATHARGRTIKCRVERSLNCFRYPQGLRCRRTPARARLRSLVIICLLESKLRERSGDRPVASPVQCPYLLCIPTAEPYSYLPAATGGRLPGRPRTARRDNLYAK